MKIEKYKVETPKGALPYNISGKGKSNIVLINGGFGPIEGWMKILPAISESSSVFSYNRFGVADSDKPKESQGGISIVNTLREALTIVGFKPPYLLVGHSLGGLYANLYARLYPNEVAGIAFLESSTTKDISLNEYQGNLIHFPKIPVFVLTGGHENRMMPEEVQKNDLRINWNCFHCQETANTLSLKKVDIFRNYQNQL